MSLCFCLRADFGILVVYWESIEVSAESFMYIRPKIMFCEFVESMDYALNQNIGIHHFEQNQALFLCIVEVFFSPSLAQVL